VNVHGRSANEPRTRRGRVRDRGGRTRRWSRDDHGPGSSPSAPTDRLALSQAASTRAPRSSRPPNGCNQVRTTMEITT
jgi:hypothetical protein